jgi:hypothetical protein
VAAPMPGLRIGLLNGQMPLGSHSPTGKTRH